MIDYREMDLERTLVAIEPSDRILVRDAYGAYRSDEPLRAQPEVVDALYEAADRLPADTKILVWDAFRSVDVQKALFQKFYDQFAYDFSDKGEDWLREYTLKFVSWPEIEKDLVPLHYSGYAIDCTLSDVKGMPLFMGTAFDEMNEYASVGFFADSQNRERLRVLKPSELEEGLFKRMVVEYNLSTKLCLLFGVAGSNQDNLVKVMGSKFVTFPSEWWHFNFDPKFWRSVPCSDRFKERVYS